MGSPHALQALRPGTYDAFAILWADPLAAPTTRCRSAAARFTVQ